MGIPTSAVGYTSATNGMGDHEVHKGHVVALERRRKTLKLNEKCAETYNYMHTATKFTQYK
jgi:hypothetical protein